MGKDCACTGRHEFTFWSGKKKWEGPRKRIHETRISLELIITDIYNHNHRYTSHCLTLKSSPANQKVKMTLSSSTINELSKSYRTCLEAVAERRLDNWLVSTITNNSRLATAAPIYTCLVVMTFSNHYLNWYSRHLYIDRSRLKFLSENEIENVMDRVTPTNTRRNTSWATNVWDVGKR